MIYLYIVKNNCKRSVTSSWPGSFAKIVTTSRALKSTLWFSPILICKNHVLFFSFLRAIFKFLFKTVILECLARAPCCQGWICLNGKTQSMSLLVTARPSPRPNIAHTVLKKQKKNPLYFVHPMRERESITQQSQFYFIYK